MKQNLINQSDIEMLDRIDRDCIAMHVCPPPRTFINMMVHDANGEQVLDMDMKSNSWVRNAYNWLAKAFFYGIGVGSTYAEGALYNKNTSGTLQGAYAVTPAFNNSVGSSAFGIVVGTGTTAETLESFNLATPIAHGTGAGQLSYQADTWGTPTYTAGTKKWTFASSRIFNNNSGASITVNEVGLISSFSGNYQMMSRDVLGAGVVVPNGGQLTVTYTQEMTFPA